MFLIKPLGIQHYLSIRLPKSSTRILTFIDAEQANKCKDYMVLYRKSHGHWPRFDMDKEKETVKSTRNESLFAVEKLIELDQMQTRDLEEMYYRTNMGYLECQEFTFTPDDKNMTHFTINIKGAEIDFAQDTKKYLDYLEDNLSMFD
jgi:hypothetical protein